MFSLNKISSSKVQVRVTVRVDFEGFCSLKVKRGQRTGGCLFVYESVCLWEGGMGKESVFDMINDKLYKNIGVQ